MIRNPAPRSLTHGKHLVTTTKSSTPLLLPVAGVVDLVAVVDMDADVDVDVVMDADVADAVEVKSQVSLFSHSHGISPRVLSGLSLRDLQRLLRSGK